MKKLGCVLLSVPAWGFMLLSCSNPFWDRVHTLVDLARAPAVETPTFSPDTGIFENAVAVGISCATPGASVIYTLDGTEPSQSNGTPYSGQLLINSTITVKALGFKEGMNSSPVAHATFTIGWVAQPTCDPPGSAGAALLTDDPRITVECGTAGFGKKAAMIYTLDNTAPSHSGLTITNGVLMTANPGYIEMDPAQPTIRIIGIYEGLADSPELTVTYTFKVAVPSISPNVGPLTNVNPLTLSCGLAGSSIKYTIGDGNVSGNGTDYAQPFPLPRGSNRVVYAQAYKSGWPPSDVVSAAFPLVEQGIKTVAGNGTTSAPNEGDIALNAGFNEPNGLAIHPLTHEIYIAVRNHHRVWRIDSTGRLRAVAGNGTPGYSGDGGPGASAQINTPMGISFDGTGNLIIADTGNYRVRRVDTSGTIETVAGIGTGGNGGIDGELAIETSISSLFNVTAESNGDFYITDYFKHRIRFVDFNDTKRIYHFAGRTDGEASSTIEEEHPASEQGLSGPSNLALRPLGGCFITCSDSRRILFVNALGNIQYYAGSGDYGSQGDGGAALSASFFYPGGIVCDAADNLYIADLHGHRIRKVTTGTKVISTIAGTGIADSAGDGGIASNARVNGPSRLSLDPAGNLYIVERAGNRVRVVSGY